MKGNLNGFEYVDLDLPSGTMWATCNVGAKRETEVGRLFVWNEFLLGQGIPKATDEVDNAILKRKFDIARNCMGDEWRTPTKIELLELIQNTTIEYCEINGVRGQKFTSFQNKDKYIFIPFTYQDYEELNVIWSSEKDNEFNHNAAFLLRFIPDSNIAFVGSRPLMMEMAIRGVFTK